MTDDRRNPTAADGELLSAYLAGELDEGAAAELERRLAAEPHLAAQLDALADALVALGGFDAAEEPNGFARRLDDRLAAAAAPADLAAHRRRRATSTQWLRIGSVAAVVALGAVMAGSMLRGGGGPTVARDAAMEESAGDSAGATSEQFSAGSRPSAPVILDTDTEVAGEAALRERYADVPEAQGLLGVPTEEAQELALTFTSAVSSRDDVARLESSADAASSAEGGGTAGGGSGAQEAPPPAPASQAQPDEYETSEGGGADGSERALADAAKAVAKQRRMAVAAAAGDPCLADIVADADAPVVPVRVETIRYEGQPAVAYVMVTARPKSPTLDRLELWVIRRASCALLVFHQY